MKKKKNKKKNLKIFLLAMIFIVLILTITKNYWTKKDFSHIKYSKEVQETMKEQNIYDDVIKKEYSETLEKMIKEKKYISTYLEEYTKINLKEREDFADLINLFLNKNYNAEEINNILEYLNDQNQQKLKEMDYIDLKDYIKVSNMEVDKIDRYNTYREKNHTDAKETVTKVNIGLDLEFYSQIETIKNPDSYTTLLNKYRAIPENYAPNDLTSLSINSNYKLRKAAADAYEKLQSAALIDNIRFYPFSAYRTKAYQNNLYTNYVKRDGKNAADTYSARPRHSEHELGLAVDIRSESLKDNLTDHDYEWMLNNAYKYGFIIRYAKGTTKITGYIEEPWHLRYLGIEVATDIHEKNITFDEYYDLYLKNKED